MKSNKSLLERERRVARRRRKYYRLKNHPFVVPVITLLVFFFLGIAAFIGLNGRTVAASDSHIVKLSIDGKQRVIPTRAKTVGDLLDRANITLNEGDVIEPEQETPIVDDNFRVNLYRARPVTVFDGEKRIQALSAATTARSVAVQIGLTVYPEDKITVEGSDGFLREGVLGQKIVVNRSTLTHINLYGTPISVRTHAKTVDELLKEKGIQLAGDDTLQPDRSAALTPNIQVFVIRNGTQIASVEEVIPMPVETVDDQTLSFGTTVVRQRGSPGKRVATYQLELRNGKEVSRKLIQQVVATEPVKQIVARGRAVYIPGDSSVLMAAAGISTSDYPYVNHIISRESGWCHTKWQGQIGYCPAFYTQLHDPSSGYGFGLCQSTPAIKMATAGADWTTNPVTQLRWCAGYAKSRYGSWEAAYNYWLANRHW